MNFLNKFPTRQILIILLPGVYLALYLSDLSLQIFTEEDFPKLSIEFNILIKALFSLSFGIFIYIIDIPKKLRFVKSQLPTNRIKKEHPDLNEVLIHQAYFGFYDNSISEPQRTKTDGLTTLFHMGINVSAVSLFSLIITLICDYFYCVSNSNYFIHFDLFFFFIVGSLGLFFSANRISDIFNNQYEAFLKSEEYAKLAS